MFTLKPLVMALLILSGSYALAANNTAIQTQDGNYNDTLLEQAGEGNNAAQIQRGDFSRSEVVQTGNGNSAQIEQESQASTPENSLRLEQIAIRTPRCSINRTWDTDIRLLFCSEEMVMT